MTTSSQWPQEDIEKLTELWNKTGLSASEISTAFEYKYSRNAILGKVNRLKLPLRIEPLNWNAAQKRIHVKNPKVKPPSQPKKKRQKPSIAAKGPIVSVFGPMMSAVPKDPRPVRKQAWEPIPGIEPVSLMERTGCCWIVTQDSPFLYCNHSVDEGSKLSYCSHHLDMYVSKERVARIRVKGLV